MTLWQPQVEDLSARDLTEWWDARRAELEDFERRRERVGRGLSHLDDETGWRPEHYVVLFEWDCSLYRQTWHWQLTAQAQKAHQPTCHECLRGTPDVRLEAHHLHYDTIGNETVGIDLLTLCRRCHEAWHELSGVPSFEPPPSRATLLRRVPPHARGTRFD
jgi:hypothetical protein